VVISCRYLFLFIIMIAWCFTLNAQQVPITNYSVDTNGQAQIEVNSTDQHYYLLQVKHGTSNIYSSTTAIALGNANKTTIKEPAQHYPQSQYRVLEYPIASPVDIDVDGVDDITELQNTPSQNPLNAAEPLNINDGAVIIESFDAFEDLSVKIDDVPWSEFLNGKEYVKFIIIDIHTIPKVYFINSVTHEFHSDFATAIGIPPFGSNLLKGQVIFHPKSISNNGSKGAFAFNYSNGHAKVFNDVQATYELLAANMPFLKNNLSYFITENNELAYHQDSSSYNASRIPILFEADIYEGLNYWGLNQTEGFGFFRQVTLDEVPGAKDIVLYEALPNTLPRVAGIMTSVIQTPLSHVNLRAIQSKIPNAFVRDPLSIDHIANLLNEYIYYKVEEDTFTIRKATLEEVNDWFEDLRPKEVQFPPLNLDYKSILPLSEIEFDMYDSYGTKCTNIATMLTFGFPENTIPNGFGIPFYYYQEFMAYNNFYEEIESLISDAQFIFDRNIRDARLKDFREIIEKADMPNWMMDELEEMHQSFPTGTSIRCRSSSNNEDLAGFNGAGLYDSKTQKPSEGHISKSIKEVYASLWNLRAYEEREFYRINHFATAMGVLCHPNYKDEKVNGVGVSADPVYDTENTFYLNTQVGEDLVTNPNANSVPEEILLQKIDTGGNGFAVVVYSNLLPTDSITMSQKHLNQMREYLNVIHNEFEALYNAYDNPSFAMDIEYKVTKENQLIIKQARPWVNYETPIVESIIENIDLKIFPNPAHNKITVHCADCILNSVTITNVIGQQVLSVNNDYSNQSIIQFSITNLPSGVYILSGFGENSEFNYSTKFVKIN